MSTKATQKSVKTATKKKSQGFTAEERAAMKERAKELKAEARANKDRAAGERDVLAAIAEMPKSDRAIGKRLHEIITASAPDLSPKTWYGMPAYAKDGKVVCFFQSADKFKSRYATLGFSDQANLDKGAMWPTSFALKELTAAEEAKMRRAREESAELSPGPTGRSAAPGSRVAAPVGASSPAVQRRRLGSWRPALLAARSFRATSPSARSAPPR
jgi:uncharacterized protein YdhG (YjbR/CyaY superfamily)